METKQVIVWRSDLRTAGGGKLRTGKIGAQMSHASEMSIFAKASFGDEKVSFDLKKDKALKSWWETGRSKVVLQCKDEKELVEIYQKAKSAGLRCALITDAGRTEFKGVPTKTCMAIGPDEISAIDKITGELQLY